MGTANRTSKRKPARRIVVAAVIFFLLGAMVNVAVAWSLVFIVNPYGGVRTVHSLTLDTPETATMIAHTSPGSLRIELGRGAAYWYLDLTGEPESAALQQPVHSSPFPTWLQARLDQPTVQVNFPKSMEAFGSSTWLVDLRGWPMNALWCRPGIASKPIPRSGALFVLHSQNTRDGVRVGTTNSSSADTLAVAQAWRIWARRTPQIEKVIPFRPIWSGFIINTVFYGTILFIPIRGPFIARRIIRKHKGRCLQCSYDLRGSDSDACPECGQAVCSAGHHYKSMNTVPMNRAVPRDRMGQ